MRRQIIAKLNGVSAHANSGNEDNSNFCGLPPLHEDAKLRDARANCGDKVNNGNVCLLNPQGGEADFLFHGLPPLRGDAKLGVAFSSMTAISTVLPSAATANASDLMTFFA
jgi:hypothetical protein